MTLTPKRRVFYSFYFDDDVMRVQQVRQMGVLEGDEPVSPNEWERIQRSPNGVKNWIDTTLATHSCVVVLIGQNTYTRPWVNYEIRKAWNDGKGLFGVYIHNLNCPRYGTSRKGPNPFDKIQLQNGALLSSRVACYDPNPLDAYGTINRNLSSWVEDAIRNRRKV